jgi:hypothetical protein
MGTSLPQADDALIPTMKTRLFLALFGLACGLLPRLSADDHGFLSKLLPPLPNNNQGPISGVFYVGSVAGTVRCVADGRIFDLKKGDKVIARGARVTTEANAKAALVFSDQTTLYLNPDSDLRVEKFDQEPFTPNNNLLIEPSNSELLVYVNQGQMVIATPQLLSGTTMLFETPEAGVFVLTGQSGGQKLYLAVTEKQTHVAMVQGKANVTVRASDGSLASLGRTLISGTQAFVKYNLNSGDTGGSDTIAVSAGDTVSGSAPAAHAAVKAPVSLAINPTGAHPPQGEFYVAAATGKVVCIDQGSTLVLRAGQTLPIAGADLRTEAGAKASIVLSDLTALGLSPGAEIRFVKYSQESFQPTATLDIEPSNTAAVIRVRAGQIDVGTPQLLAGSSLVFTSDSGAVKLIPVETGGDQATLRVSADHTQVLVVTGQATATPRAPDGTLVSIGETLGAGQQGTIKPTLGNNAALQNAVPRGDFRATKVSGQVEITADDNTLPAEAGESFSAEGATIRTGAGAKATLLLSSLTSFDLGAKTEFGIERFAQDPFSPSSRLDVQPSVTHTRINLPAGVVTVTSARLRPESELIFHTPHGAVQILPTASGGDQAILHVTAKDTTLQLLAGKAVARSIQPDGQLAAGQEVGPGQEAVIQPTGQGARRGGVLAAADALTTVAVMDAPVVPAGATIATVPGDARVLRVVGSAEMDLPRSGGIVAVTLGMRVPVGAVLSTGHGSKVYLQAYTGAIAVLQPDSRALVERLETVTANGEIIHRRAIFDCQRGTVVSMIDPALHNLDTYAIRTPRGLATAHGTSFAVTVNDTDSSVAATADSVVFTGTDGTTYTIQAGNVTFTPAGGQAQAPVPLSQAVAANPAFAGVVQAAVATVSTIVQDNIGNLAAGPATNLLSQVVGVASAAIPAQAASFVGQAVTAVSTSGASTGGSAAAAAAAVTAAAAAAAPAQSSQVAVAASQAAPALSATVAAAAAQVNPTQAVQVASAVAQSLAQGAPATGSAAVTQSAASVAAAVTAAVPQQAAPVAAAVMQALTQASPQASAATVTQSASTLASAVTSNSPSQAAPVATALSQVVTQSGSAAGANATSAGAIIAAANQGAQNPNTTPSATAGTVQATAVTVSGLTNSSSASSASAGGTTSGTTGGGSAPPAIADQQTSVVVTTANGAASSVTTSTSGGGNQATSITVTQFNGGQASAIASDVDAATSAQSSVTFNTSTSGSGGTSGGTTVTATSTAPQNSTPETNPD